NTSGADGRRLATRLWNTDIHEARMAAAEVLCMIESDLGHADLPLVEDLLRSSRTWALVDTLAVHVAGPVLARDNEANAVLDRWATDPDFWIRRSALLAHLKDLRSGGGDWERFTRYADAMLEEKEFFIRKAIGWILRDTSRRRPDLVADWFTPRAHRASGVTVREAVKKLSDEQAAEINWRYRSSR
ncbi:MAG: DNA alkylation repair protein, partial [Acidimicrobiia bacterium]|nr:DNA alkylation repair protein [Acidimicrobiia bacterium]